MKSPGYTTAPRKRVSPILSECQASRLTYDVGMSYNRVARLAPLVQEKEQLAKQALMYAGGYGDNSMGLT